MTLVDWVPNRFPSLFPSKRPTYFRLSVDRIRLVTSNFTTPDTSVPSRPFTPRLRPVTKGEVHTRYLSDAGHSDVFMGVRRRQGITVTDVGRWFTGGARTSGRCRTTHVFGSTTHRNEHSFWVGVERNRPSKTSSGIPPGHPWGRGACVEPKGSIQSRRPPGEGGQSWDCRDVSNLVCRGPELVVGVLE